MSGQLAALGMAWERFPAVAGSDLPVHLKPYFCDAEGRIATRLTPGELGCYASHIGVWQRIVEADIPCALVCEDDAQLPSDMEQILSDALAALPEGWDMVHLSRAPDRAFKPLSRLGRSQMLIRHSRIPAGTACYLISRAGAAKMLAPVPRRWAVDQDTRWPWLFGIDAYGIDPPPVNHLSVTSTIGHDRRSGLRRGLRRSPFRSPASFLYNLRKLGSVWWLRCFVANCGIKLASAWVPLGRLLTLGISATAPFRTRRRTI
jgi:glycosyl transferase, family 25